MKARQATSRQKQIDKLSLDDIKPSSRQNPYIRFEFDKKLYRNALEVNAMVYSYDDNEQILSNISFMIEAGEKLAIIGENGIGKTTLLKAMVEDSRQAIVRQAHVAKAQCIDYGRTDQPFGYGVYRIPEYVT